VHRSPNGCHTVDQSIDEYVLGILDSSQRAAIDQHVKSCPTCASLIASYRQTTAALALAVPIVTPPATARTALMLRIAATPQTASPSAIVFAGDLDTLRTPTLPAATPIATLPTQPESQSAWWRNYAAPLATLPLLLALGLVAAWGLNNYSQLNQKQNEVAAKDSQIALLSNQLSSESSQGMADLSTSPATQRYTLAPDVNGTDDGGQGVLLTNSLSNQAGLQVTGLEPGTYTVYVQMENGDMVPKTEFVVGALGSGSTLVDLGGQVTDLKSVRIRPTTTMTETDVAIDQQVDVLITTIGPDISDGSDTSVQKP
jgi:hypothetical protein